MKNRDTILFLHGLESVPGGAKADFLKECGYRVLNPALSKHSFKKAVATAQSIIDKEKPSVIVGSSRGGAIAMSVNAPEATLVLVAPAWKRYRQREGAPAAGIPSNTIIIHSKNDKVIPFADSEALALASGAKLIATGSSHRMADPRALMAIAAAVATGTKESDNEDR